MIKKVFLTLVLATCAPFLTWIQGSADFELDYDSLTTGSEYSASDDFQLQGGIMPIEVSSSVSADYAVETVNSSPYCGNGVLEFGEVCDNTNFNGESCSTFGFTNGGLICLDCRTIDTSGCSDNRGGDYSERGDSHISENTGKRQLAEEKTLSETEDSEEISVEESSISETGLPKPFEKLVFTLETSLKKPSEESSPAESSPEEQEYHSASELPTDSEIIPKYHLANDHPGEIVQSIDTPALFTGRFFEPVFFILAILSIFIWGKMKLEKSRRKISRTTRSKSSFRNILLFLVLGTNLLIGVTFPIPSVFAIPSQFILYEGRLLDTSRAPLTTAHEFRFSLWSSDDFVADDVDENGVINVAAPAYSGWQEEHTVTPTANGTFSLELGTVTPLPAIDFTIHRFLQIEIKTSGEPGTDYQVMDPTGDATVDTNDRKQIGSVPYALHAEDAYRTEQESFILDADDTVNTAGTGTVGLFFGNALNKILAYDVDNSSFVFNDSVRIEGDLTVTGLINGVDITDIDLFWKNPVGHTRQFVDGGVGVGGIRAGGKIVIDDETQVNEGDTITVTYNAGGSNFVLTARDVSVSANCEFDSGVAAVDNTALAISILTAIDACVTSADFSGQSVAMGNAVYIIHDTPGTIGNGTIVFSGGGFSSNDMDAGTTFSDLHANETRIVEQSGTTSTWNEDDEVWVQISGSTGVTDATTTTKGIVELATDGENAAGVVVQGNDSRLHSANTDTGTVASTFAVNTSGNSLTLDSAGLTADRVITFPDADTIIVGADTVQVLTKKTIDGDDNTLLNIDWNSLKNQNKTMLLTPEYNNLTINPDGTSNLATLMQGYEVSSDRHYYVLSSQQDTLQDLSLDIVVPVPDDFQSWQAIPLQIFVKSLTTNSTQNQLDVVVEDSNGTSVTLSGGTDLVSSVANTWEQKNITFQGAPTFTPGDSMLVRLSLQAHSHNKMYVGTIQLNYIGK